MAVDVTLLNNNSTTNITTNFQRVITALEDAVSRSGTAPNNMSADLDMDGNDIINIGSLSLEGGNTLEGYAAAAEAAQTAAEAAQALSEAAVSDAETAATNAESAVTDAESAETAALAAQSAAEASATAAATSVASIASNTIDVDGSININLSTHAYDLFRFHTSTGTANLDAAATLGDAFTCFIKADGVAVTIDPNGSETINGASTLVLADGQSAKLYCNGTTWNAVLIGAGSGGGGIVYEEKTSAYTAEAGDGIGANTTSGAFSVTLPASPSVGDVVIVADTHGQWATNNLTIARNGNNIQRLAEDLVCDTNNLSVELVYFSNGWIVYPSGSSTAGVPLIPSNNLSDVDSVAASRGNLNTWVDKTAAYDLVVGDWVYADTSGGAFTLTLPATAADGAEIRVADPNSVWAVNSVIVARNGNTIAGNADDMECSTGAVCHIFTFDNSAGNWRVRTEALSGGDFGNAPKQLLETIIVDGESEVEITSNLDDTYEEYEIKLIGFQVGTDEQAVQIQTSSDGGSSYASAASDYRFIGTHLRHTGTTVSTSITRFSAVQSNINLCYGAGPGNASTERLNAVFKLYQPSEAAPYVTGEFVATYQWAGDGTLVRNQFSWERRAAAIIDAVRIYSASGTLGTGIIKVYGVR